MSDHEVRNGTSRNMLERCASVNEYFDISFKVGIVVVVVVVIVVVVVVFFKGAHCVPSW